jgi:hypothetical protein
MAGPGEDGSRLVELLGKKRKRITASLEIRVHCSWHSARTPASSMQAHPCPLAAHPRACTGPLPLVPGLCQGLALIGSRWLPVGVLGSLIIRVLGTYGVPSSSVQL